MMDTLLQAEQLRADCLIRRDLEALRDMLCDDLFYIHATGIRHNKSQLLSFLENGPQFLTVGVTDPVSCLSGEYGVVTGGLQMSILRRGEAMPSLVSSWMSQIWIRSAESTCGWRLKVFQSTRQVLQDA